MKAMKANQEINPQEKRFHIPIKVLEQARAHAFMLRVLQEVATQMEKNDVSKTELATRLKVGKSRISNMFHAGNMTMKTLYEIGEALDATIEVKLRPKQPCILKAEQEAKPAHVTKDQPRKKRIETDHHMAVPF